MRLLPTVALPLFVSLAAPAFAQDVAALERQLEQARNAAPMRIEPFMAVKREPQYFGDYEQRPNLVFKRGEKLMFYGEPKNLVINRNAQGVYEPAFDVDLDIKGPGGQSMKKDQFMSFKLPTRSRVQDIFLNLTLSLDSAPPGKYNVKFTVRDRNSKKSASAEADVTIQ